MVEKTLRYFLHIAYCGTHYHGWQQQNNAVTIQATLEACFSQLFNFTIKVVGSSRTDTGVHAKQQVAHVDLPDTVDVARLRYQLNRILPFDIAVLAIQLVKPHAHARFDAASRTYEYTISQHKSPFHHATSYWWYGTLHVPNMNKAAEILCRQQDFKRFCKIRSGDHHFLCNVIEAQWRSVGDQLIFYITANRFLRGMVRILVSLLLKVGRGHMSLCAFEELFTSPTHDITTGMVPACGLTLMKVSYPTTVLITSRIVCK